jgi:protocatechuate 3,4-dioxygenase beta subunit
MTNQVVARIRRIIELREHHMTMKLSFLSVGTATALVLAPIFAAGAYAWQLDQPSVAVRESSTVLAQAQSQKFERGAPNRQRAKTEAYMKTAVRERAANRSDWKPGPVPQTVPIRVGGQATDELGKPIGRAMIFLYSSGVMGTKLVGQAITDEKGNYVIAESHLPVVTARHNVILPKESAPYAQFVVCGIAPGLGLAWSRDQSIYASAEIYPDDIQRRLPLGRPVEVSLTFPKAASLAGRITDDDGQPVAGCKVQIDFADMLDDDGRETSNHFTGPWRYLPGSIGLTISDRDGQVVLDRLPDRTTFRLAIQHPEFEQTRLALYAATIGGLNLPPGRKLVGGLNGPLPHEIKTGKLEITFPKLRRIIVSLVGDDTQKPVPGISLYSLSDNFQTGFASFGTTDAAGTVRLALPPGKYRGIRAEPASIESRYIRTEDGPLDVAPGHDEQRYDFVLRSGCEIQFEAIDALTNSPISDALFWQIPVDDPAQRESITFSTFGFGAPWTDASGILRVVLKPEPKKLYRFEFAGIRQPNTVGPDAADKQGYLSDPTTSEPVELEAGKSIRLRFALRKSE